MTAPDRGLAASGSPGTPPPAVRMTGIVKRFPDLVALGGIDFEVAGGEIHALLGENGAGKTTLVSVLAGLYPADEGRIEVAGRPVRIRSPRDARRLGIGMVHQRFRLSEKHTVLENLLLAREDVPYFLARSRVRAWAEALLARLALPLDLDLPIWQLSVGEQQRVEIAKALSSDARILILDEPTAVLGPQETPGFFAALSEMKRSGLSIVFITHKTAEVLAVADRVTVLAKGRRVATLSRGEFDERELARKIIGRDLPAPEPRARTVPGEPLLAVTGLSVKNDRGLPALDGVDLAVRAGEIHGIAGVSGNGQAELAETLAGLRRPWAGRITLAGESCDGWSPARAIARGVRYVPAERNRVGVAAGLSIAENLILKHHRSERFARGGFLRTAAIANHARETISRYGIAAPSPRVPVATLSGGNLQKVIAARETDGSPILLVAAYPTRGLDLGSARALHDVLRRERDRGAGIVFISEELRELLEIADRLSVLSGGRIALSGPASELAPEAIGLAMAGRQTK
ncbi:MAG: ABC transporter ATP-binding protein [Planctomycetes bacterium]|nr:ABC transporter ATP-binding protein [Planctomycetota bacterium]